MTLSQEVMALRSSCGITRLAHVVALRLSGPDVFPLLDALSSRPLFLREGQMCHSLLLREDAGIYADVYLCSGEDAFYLLSEGPAEGELIDYIERQRGCAGDADVTIESLAQSHALWGINGPYAFEVVSSVLGPSLLGMPYLTLLHHDKALCFRGGKTGEYGYDLLVPKAGSAELVQELERAVAGLELCQVGIEALDQCALENWFFSMRHLRETTLSQPLTPLELQLQWRVSYDRQFVGSDALRARRAAGIAVRATSVRSQGVLRPGQEVYFEQQPVGEVLAASRSETLSGSVGLALLSLELAHPGVGSMSVRDEAGGQVALTTASPPLINNRSLHIDPHRHSYATRDVDRFPELVYE